MKYYLLSLGCQMNISDSERVKTVLNRMGFAETENEDEAALLGIMACSVRQKAIDRIYSLIHKWNNRKKERHCITFLSGCVLPVDRERLLKKFDLLFSINELPQLPVLLRQYGVSNPYSDIAATMDVAPDPSGAGKSPAVEQFFTPTTVRAASKINSKNDLARDFWNVRPSYSSQFQAYVSIQNGCDKFCTFCAVPYTRGREVSRPSSEILREVFELMKAGYRSITLLGQNVNSYGLDTKEKDLSFAQLLERIGGLAQELEHRCWIYFTSPHPRDMNNEVLEVIARYPCLAEQIHLPLQSGDDKLLFRMNRNHSIEKYRNIVSSIKTLLPRASLFTDIIVGFCGESEEQFQNTREAMLSFQYNMAYIAMYSPRPGATSYHWKDTVPLEIKKQRYRELSMVLQKTASEKNKPYIGKKIPVLVEHAGRKQGLIQARTEGKIPVMLKNESSLPDEGLEGKFITAEITGQKSLSLLGSTNGAPY